MIIASKLNTLHILVFTYYLNFFIISQLQLQISQFLKKHLFVRELLLSNLKNGSEFDVLVIGGGATGCGVALDAVTRGMFL